MSQPRHQSKPPKSDTFHINDRCIGCTLCAILAPKLFGEDLSAESISDGAYVRQQPANEAEMVLHREVMLLCPTNAIEKTKSGP